jgi:hypothetical protein
MRFAGRLIRFSIAVGLAIFVTANGRCETAQTPQTVVEKYCTLDAHGANFSASNPNAKAIFELLIHEDEAGYDTSVIIKSYRIGNSRVDTTSADIDVIYSDLGTLGGELSVKKEPHTETVTFHLTLVDNSWKIDGLRILPHISQSWMLSNLQRSLKADERAGKDDPKLRAAITEIAKW